MNLSEGLSNIEKDLKNFFDQEFGGQEFECKNDLQKLYNLETDTSLGLKNISPAQQSELQNAIKSKNCQEIIKTTHDLGL